MTQPKICFRIEKKLNCDFISIDFEEQINSELKAYFNNIGIKSEIIQPGDRGGGFDISWWYSLILNIVNSFNAIKKFADGFFVRRLGNNAPVFQINIYHTIEMSKGVWDWNADVSSIAQVLLYHLWQSKKFLDSSYGGYNFSATVYIVVPSFGFHLNLSIDKDSFKESTVGQLALFCENILLKSNIEEMISISHKPFIRQLIKRNRGAEMFYYFRGTKSRRFSYRFRNIKKEKTSKGIWISPLIGES